MERAGGLRCRRHQPHPVYARAADGLRELSERIRAQVWALIRGLLKKAGRGKGDLREVVLAGNTAMQLLFTGHSVRGLAAAPFLPETLFRGDAEDALEGIPPAARAVHRGVCRR